jgi:hypothetical protein
MFLKFQANHKKKMKTKFTDIHVLLFQIPQVMNLNADVMDYYATDFGNLTS